MVITRVIEIIGNVVIIAAINMNKAYDKRISITRTLVRIVHLLPKICLWHKKVGWVGAKALKQTWVADSNVLETP